MMNQAGDAVLTESTNDTTVSMVLESQAKRSRVNDPPSEAVEVASTLGPTGDSSDSFPGQEVNPVAAKVTAVPHPRPFRPKDYVQVLYDDQWWDCIVIPPSVKGDKRLWVRFEADNSTLPLVRGEGLEKLIQHRPAPPAPSVPDKIASKTESAAKGRGKRAAAGSGKEGAKGKKKKSSNSSAGKLLKTDAKAATSKGGNKTKKNEPKGSGSPPSANAKSKSTSGSGTGAKNSGAGCALPEDIYGHIGQVTSSVMALASI